MKFIKKLIFTLAALGVLVTVVYVLAPEDTKVEMRLKFSEITGKAKSLSLNSLLDDSAHNKLKEVHSDFADVVKKDGESLWSTLMSSGDYLKDGKITEEEAKELASKLINSVSEKNPDLDMDRMSIPDLNKLLSETFLTENK